MVEVVVVVPGNIKADGQISKDLETFSTLNQRGNMTLKMRRRAWFFLIENLCWYWTVRRKKLCFSSSLDWERERDRVKEREGEKGRVGERKKWEIHRCNQQKDPAIKIFFGFHRCQRCHRCQRRRQLARGCRSIMHENEPRRLPYSIRFQIRGRGSLTVARNFFSGWARARFFRNYFGIVLFRKKSFGFRKKTFFRKYPTEIFVSVKKKKEWDVKRKQKLREEFQMQESAVIDLPFRGERNQS